MWINLLMKVDYINTLQFSTYRLITIAINGVLAIAALPQSIVQAHRPLLFVFKVHFK